MLVSLNDVTQVRAAKVLLSHVTGNINEGDLIGVVGINGAGKSSLLRMIAGLTDPDEGARTTKSGLNIGFMEQNASVSGENTVYEEMCRGAARLLDAWRSMREIEGRMALLEDHGSPEAQSLGERYSAALAYFESNGGYELDARIDMILAGVGFADLDLNQSCASLSGGEKTRLALARLLLQNPELLLLDEPTNHLDFDSVIWLENYLRQYKGTLVIVSHDRYFLDRICNRIWEMDNGAVALYKGNYTAYMTEREALYLRQTEEFAAQQEKMRELEQYIAMNKARASTAAMAHSREKELARLQETAIPKPRPPYNMQPLHFRPVYDGTCTSIVLQIENLELHADLDPSLPVLCKGVNLEVRREERVAVVGPNGVGKSTLLKYIMRYAKPPYPAGPSAVRWGLNARPSYFAQDDGGLNRDNTVLQELSDWFPRCGAHELRSLLACLGFRGEDVEKPIQGLSGGETARLKLALLMQRGGNVLVLDEPTNHLDIPAREEIEKSLTAFSGPVLVVSHDRYFLSRVPTRVVELLPDGFVNYPEGFAQYEQARQDRMERQMEALRIRREQRRQEQQKARRELESETDGKRSGHRSKQERARAAAEQQRRSELERRIAELEAMQTENKKALEDPETFRDAERARACCGLLEQIEAELSKLMEEWVQLEANV